MLTQEDLEKIRTQGACLEGEGTYYVKDGKVGFWRLTVRGFAFYRRAIHHFGISHRLQLVMAEQELLELTKSLLRARTLELGDELALELEQGGVEPSQRLVARTFLEGSLDRAMQVASHHNQAVRRGVLPGPTPSTSEHPLAQESYWGELPSR